LTIINSLYYQLLYFKLRFNEQNIWVCIKVVTTEHREIKKKLNEERNLNRSKDVSPETKDRHLAHRDQFESLREPLLTGLTSEFDLKLFRDAQMQAALDPVHI